MDIVEMLPKRGTITLDEYRAFEPMLTRPLTWGPMKGAAAFKPWCPPEPIGQVMDAERREMAWEALRRRCAALKCAGSLQPS